MTINHSFVPSQNYYYSPGPQRQIMSPSFVGVQSLPKPSFFPPQPYSVKPTPHSDGRPNTYPQPSISRAHSTSPVQPRSKNVKPISVSSEITVSRVPRTTLHCSSAPKKLGANSQVKHKRYADGSYANAPHPTELGHPRF
mmetsp:Transcript_7793/g.13120  ORF Transcript_7793/g.13120 Transcript_7793/m.13120 type:complete len:140 (+) Transcript_7793:143-562(+)